MKKTITISLVLLLLPNILRAAATTSVPWIASSTPSSFLQPTIVNGVNQAIKVNGTATSTINKLDVENLNVSIGASMPASLSLTGFTQGSTLFVGPSGTIAQDNANFFWDDTNNRLGIGTAAPNGKLVVVGSSQAGSSADTGVNSFRFTTGTGLNTDNSLSFGIHDSDYAWIQATKPGTSNNSLVFNPQGGNTGISTTSPQALLSFPDGTTQAGGIKFGSSNWIYTSSPGNMSNDSNLAASSFRTRSVGGRNFTVSIADASTPTYKMISDGGGAGQITRFGTEYNGPMDFETNTTVRMTILATGEVGIGTTTPWGQLSVTNTSANPSLVIEDSASPDSSPFIIDSAGAVGIGTANPTYKLHIVNTNAGGVSYPLNLQNSADTANTAVGIYFTPTSLPNFDQGTAQILDTKLGGVSDYQSRLDFNLANTNGTMQTLISARSGTGTLTGGTVGIASTTPWATFAINPTAGTAANQFVVGSSTRTTFLIDNSGNVGIGTTSPSSLLGIGNGLTNGGLYFTTTGLGIGKLAPVHRLDVGNPTASVSSGSVVIKQNLGNDGFATEATSNDSFIRFWDDGTVGAFEVNYQSTAGYKPMVFYTNNVEMMRLDTSGRLGIGTTSPFSTLSITGNSSIIPISVSSTTATIASSTLFMVDKAGDHHFGGGTPTLSSCGTSPVLDGNSTDQAGTITVGATTASCTLTFSVPKLSKPHCVVTSQTGTIAISYTESTTAIVVTNATLGGDLIDYFCPLGH